jgi:hypothetical protein
MSAHDVPPQTVRNINGRRRRLLPGGYWGAVVPAVGRPGGPGGPLPIAELGGGGLSAGKADPPVARPPPWNE